MAYHKHDEEGDSPDGPARKLQDDLGVGDEYEAGARVDHIFDGHSLKMRLEHLSASTFLNFILASTKVVLKMILPNIENRLLRLPLGRDKKFNLWLCMYKIARPPRTIL